MAPEIHLALFVDGTYIYATEKHKCHVLSKSQCGLTAVKSWCDHWSLKVSEGKTLEIYFSRRLKGPWGHTATEWMDHPGCK
jgi:hypothetical protein